MQFDDADASGKAGAEIKGQVGFQWEVLRHAVEGLMQPPGYWC